MNELLNIKDLQQRIALYEDMEAYHALYDHYFNNLQSFCFSFVITPHFKNPITSLDDLDIEPMVNMDNPKELCISADLLEQNQGY